MIPQSGVTYKNGVKRIRHPTHTYRLDLREPETDTVATRTRTSRPRITQYADDLPAMEQAVFKILRTDRYRHEIYNHNYGVELNDLFGKPIPYVKAELPRRITEALLADDRINAVDSFTYTEKSSAGRRTTVSVTFTVHTLHGSFTATREVEV